MALSWASIMSSTSIESLVQRAFWTISVLAITTLTVRFCIKLISQRRYFRKLQAQGLPMPPHSLLFGHLLVIAKAVGSLPSNADSVYIPTVIQKEYPELGSLFYLDLYPITYPMLVTGSQDALHQCHVKHVLDKPYLLRCFLRPLTDGLDIVSMNGAHWKKWRAVFNPGFSTAQVSKLVPVIVENMKIYCKKLDIHAAKQDVFAMKPLTDNLIVDIIGKVVLGVDFNSQQEFNQIVHSLRTQIRWLIPDSGFNLIDLYNPYRPFLHWYHSRILNRLLGKELDQQIMAWQNTSHESKPQRSVTELSLDSYAQSQGDDKRTLLDPHFRKVCLSQIKIFLFAGHDTTSSATCFIYWSLSRNPKALARLREEHTKVFGPDPCRAAELIMQSPQLVGQLPFTTAVIKESFRLYPPSSSVRAGQDGIEFVDKQGRYFPTKGCLIWCSHHMIHHDPTYWPEPYSFIPERWLVSPEHPLYPRKGMWRPFEVGPRNCIAQELAMQELKILLVLVCRTYNFKPAYDEMDAKSGKTQTEIFGEKAYQSTGLHPRDGLPVRVERI